MLLANAYVHECQCVRGAAKTYNVQRQLVKTSNMFGSKQCLNLLCNAHSKRNILASTTGESSGSVVLGQSDLAMGKRGGSTPSGGKTKSPKVSLGPWTDLIMEHIGWETESKLDTQLKPLPTVQVS